MLKGIPSTHIFNLCLGLEFIFSCVYLRVKHAQEVELEDLKKELHVRPTEKLVEDLRKKVKILQVM